jgi:hypothetical protein
LQSATTSEGALIAICTTVGNWTAAGITDRLRANALDLAFVGPRLKVEITTGRPSSTGSSASCCDASSHYYGYASTISLNPSSTSSFASAPDAVMAHEYGHAWTMYWLYMNPANAGAWDAYANFRWANADGSVKLAQHSKHNTSYSWTDHEMAADDYRRLLGSPAAQSQLTYLNSGVPDSRQVAGLAAFFLDTWR